MSKLWQKNNTKLDPSIEKYTVGTDYLLDMQLMPYDIEASKAHAKGLLKIGILGKTDLEKLLVALSLLEKEFQEGKIKIEIKDEDCHTVIENYLVSKLGNFGKKIHTGRSRNDQVLVAMRLYSKDQLTKIKKEATKLSKIFLKLAKKYQNIPFPGYSHTQQAMLSSLGHYFLSFLEGLLDDIELIEVIYKHIDKNPLGSAAGFGSSFDLDREFMAKELGFKKIQINSLYCQNSRGKFESLVLEGLSQVMITLGKMANDFILFTSQEFNFFNLSDAIVTGSSMMPQKRNFDCMEIMRGYVSVVAANQNMIKDISKNILSGYNRDLQLIKKPLFESFEIVLESLKVMSVVLENMQPNVEVIKSKISKEIFSADIANKLVKEKGMAFRDAYKEALKKLSSVEIDFNKSLREKISLGATGNLGMDYYEKRL